MSDIEALQKQLKAGFKSVRADIGITNSAVLALRDRVAALEDRLFPPAPRGRVARRRKRPTR